MNRYIGSLISLFKSINILILLFLLITSLFLTYSFEWWDGFFLKQIDLFILSFFFLYFLFKENVIFLFFSFFLVIIVNLYGLAPIVSNFFLIFLSFIIGFGIQKLIKNFEVKFFSISTLCIGLGSISLIINLTSFFKINTSIFLFILFTLIGVLVYLINYSEINNSFKNIKLDTKSFKVGFFLTNILILISSYILMVVVVPESSWDALSTHLVIPKLLKLNQFWEYNVFDYIWAVQPFGGQWLFSFLFFFGGEVAVKLFPALLLFLMSLYSFNFFKSRGFQHNLACAASLMVISLPLSLTLIDKLHVDIIHAFLVTAIFFEIINQNRNWKILFILTGICFAVKSSTILLIPLLAHLYFLDNRKVFRLKNLLICFVLGFLFCFLPYLVAFIKTGSPTFPQYNEIFRSELISKVAWYNPQFSNQSISDFFYTTFQSKVYANGHNSNGSIGIGFFVLGLSSLIFFFNNKKYNFLLLFYILFAIVVMFMFQTILRYIYFLLPSLIFLFILINFDYFKNSKLFLYALILILLVNVAKYDKVSVYKLVDNYNLYLSKEKLIKYDLSKQPLKKLALKLNDSDEFKDKKIFILTKTNQPKYYFFDMRVAFFNWHSFKAYMAIINSGNLNDALKKEKFDYVIYSLDYNPKTLSKVFKDHPKDVGKFYDKIDKFFINKVL